MKVLITGANGFVGRRLANVLRSEYDQLVCCSRNSGSDPEFITSPALSANADWGPLLTGVDVVVHLAGKAHNLGEPRSVALEGFKQTNVEGTLRLAEQALAANVKRFIFISSIGVNGSSTSEIAFDESSPAAPHADYAESKLAAERKLEVLCRGTSMELVIIRPPLVYAAQAPGNFRRLLKIVSLGLPLPFAAINNRRSMIALDNLVDFIRVCVAHPKAANSLFLVSDGVDLSTGEIVKLIAKGMNKKVRLVAVPKFLLLAGATLLGKRAIYAQLCGSLVIDSSKAQSTLGWVPVVSPQQALMESGRDFKIP
ncbi:NAD-dependent dehydratase [Pseudomonas umsongensis]|uniref:NAD-dependent dehydratase n=1 Tax=Pseudomonas umsongensis TaxID=198618 RepID=A0ABX4DXH3_9PSED|nr:NAD-dependent epimerase/dehydratase family protein [Pseudomonas umsongensis]OXR33425.1 NAD-dependent dehydratase [Pseudomonas umsongensis]SDS57494.1 Nucleoside-diphosphate-sugar epimerase [Pseudomonas umsongensis]